MVLADLGLSSMQIDDPAHGFSFKEAGPLDMRLNPTRGRPASALLSELGESDLAEILTENSDQPHARELASAIHHAHAREPLMTTQALVAVVCDATAPVVPGVSDRTADDPVRRVFQALRIAVNDEFGALTELLRTLPTCLRPGGRVAILSFHSGEDRRVKSAFKEGLARPLRLDCRGGDPPLSRREAGKSSVVVGKAEVCRPQLESPPSSSTAPPPCVTCVRLFGLPATKSMPGGARNPR